MAELRRSARHEEAYNPTPTGGFGCGSGHRDLPAEAPGFRAGICTPFHFYNLKSERETNLMIYPFQIMDNTLIKYLQLNPDAAIEKINSIVDKIKNVNGLFISLWHNSSLSNTREWAGWESVYENMILKIKNR